MRSLDWIITSNAAAAGREAAEADARGDRATAGRIFEANRAAEAELAAPGVPVVLARDAYRAFIAAYVEERRFDLPGLDQAVKDAYTPPVLNRRPL